MRLHRQSGGSTGLSSAFPHRSDLLSIAAGEHAALGSRGLRVEGSAGDGGSRKRACLQVRELGVIGASLAACRLTIRRSWTVVLVLLAGRAWLAATAPATTTAPVVARRCVRLRSSLPARLRRRGPCWRIGPAVMWLRPATTTGTRARAPQNRRANAATTGHRYTAPQTPHPRRAHTVERWS